MKTQEAVPKKKDDLARMQKRLTAPNEVKAEATLVAGAAAGAAIGAIAGPVGAIAGAIAGSAVGATMGAVLEKDDLRADAHEEELDREIGVIDGDIGAASAKQPPARRGAYSASVAGVGARRESAAPSEGPMQSVEKDE